MEQIAASGTSVVIDFSQAQFIDSQVIAWLLRWWKRSRERADLHLAISTGEDATTATRLLQLVHIADTLPCYPTTAQAIHHLQTGSDRNTTDNRL